MKFLFPVLGLAIVTGMAAWAWWIMTYQPRRWSALVDRENDLWRGKGKSPGHFVEVIKRWEKGRVIRWIAGITTILGCIGVVMSAIVFIRVMELEHQRLRKPFNPALDLPHGLAAAPHAVKRDVKQPKAH